MISILPTNKKVGGRKQLLDYNQKRLENPFYSRKKKINHVGGLKTTLTIISFLVVLTSLGWFIFASSYWKINDVSINGLDRMSNDEILKMVRDQLSGRNWLILPQNNLLFFNQEKFLTLARDKYRFQDIQVRKEWPNKLIVGIKEKTLACAWNEGDRYYLLDSEGYVLDDANPLELKDKNYPLISNESTLRIEGGQIKADKNYIGKAQEITDAIRSKAQEEISIDRFIVDNDIDTIKLVTTDGVKVYFNTAQNLNNQIEKLLLLKREKLKDDFGSKKYIDLRFGDKIYFQ